jgi:uncharacterized delta-60 repeat protein
MDAGPDGSTVLEHGFTLVRVLPNGDLDPGFGVGGTARLPEALEGLSFLPESLAVDSQNRVLIFGTAQDPHQSISIPPFTTVPASWGVVMRLAPNGDPDGSFGEGKGFVRSDFGLRTRLDSNLPTTRAGGGVVDSQDRPLFIARVAGPTPRCSLGHTTYGFYPAAMIRLTAAGAPDPAFGGDGISEASGNETFPYPLIAVASGDEPAAAVNTGNCRRGGNRIARLTSDGAPMTTFGTAGSRYYPGLSMSLVEASGSLILHDGGSTTSHVVRTQPSGSFDKSFGKNGTATVTMPPGTERTLEPVGVDARGGIVLVGRFSLPAPHTAHRGKPKHPHSKRSKRTRSFVAIGRLRPNGKFDRSLGKRGWIVTSFASPTELTIEGAQLDAQGRLLVAVGSDSAGQPPGARVILARYLLDD